MTSIKSINPYNNEVLKEYQELKESELERALELANFAFKKWRKIPFNERAILMHRCAEVMINNKNKYANLISLEMGKPIRQSIAEVEKSASACTYYADNAEKFLNDELIQSDASKSFVSFEPIGCVLAVMPWNFPFWQVFRFAAPAVMAGNVGLLKHASNVPQCSLSIEEIFREAGFPEGIFQSLIIGSSKVKYLIEHPVVKAVTLTGSEKAGIEVAMQAGQHIKKTVLELGGSDAFIVLKDADIQKAAETAVSSRMINNGQSCIAAKRFIVEKEVYDLFIQLMKQKMESLVIGDPLEEKTDVGPLARVDLANELHSQVEKTLKSGAKLYYQKSMDFKGAFYPPSIISEVKPGMVAYEEELFGPVATVLKANDVDDAIRIANDSKFGLGAGIWTNDVAKGISLARDIESGAVFVNGLVKSDPRLPFGGVKASGYGRELSYFGIREFVNIKSIWVK